MSRPDDITHRSPRRSTSTPASGEVMKRTRAKAEMTALACSAVTSKVRAKTGRTGMRMPKPRATQKATPVRTATSRGSPFSSGVRRTARPMRRVGLTAEEHRSGRPVTASPYPPVHAAIRAVRRRGPVVRGARPWRPGRLLRLADRRPDAAQVRRHRVRAGRTSTGSSRCRPCAPRTRPRGSGARARAGRPAPGALRAGDGHHRDPDARPVGRPRGGRAARARAPPRLQCRGSGVVRRGGDGTARSSRPPCATS